MARDESVADGVDHWESTGEIEYRLSSGERRRVSARAAINGARISRIRSFIKKVEAACEAGDKDAAAAALKEAQPEMARGVARGVLHRNTASRKLSRLTKRVAAIDPAVPSLFYPSLVACLNARASNWNAERT